MGIGKGEEVIGEGSTYQVVGGSITFKKGFAADGDENFVGSVPVPAAPGVLVPWRKMFSVGRDQHTDTPVFSLTESVELLLSAKLQMVFKRHGMYTDAGKELCFETPAKRGASIKEF